MRKLNIAIDGPAGAGKSTVAKLVAKELGYTYIDTGAMYRALTYKALENLIDLTDEDRLHVYLLSHSLLLKNEDGMQKVFMDQEDITEKIRTPDVSRNVSLVASHPKVRHQMVKLQRQLAENMNVVMDGRDIGTHVLPQAKLKIFLTASIEKRAQRRYQELSEKGYEADYNQIKDEIALRDKKDQERATSPLKKANDAILLDTSNLTIDQVVKEILKMVEEIGGEQ